MPGKIILAVSLLLSILFFACNTIRTGLSGSKSAHEQYRERLVRAGFDKTPYGLKWISEADKSLVSPINIDLPFKAKGYFAADKPLATSYRFSAKRGEKVLISLTTVPAPGFIYFADLYSISADSKPSNVATMDTTTRAINYEIEKDGSYLIRLQSELMWGVEYSISITTAPSLAFPVRKNDNPRVSSFWGADRDAGARSHEGIDIFAKKLTPAIASADGYITRVNENTLGGKVVFLRPDGKDISLYYAHLDSQLVSSGQRVKEGDVVGLIGNTGNARTTAAHLHFGIYTNGGAIDPFPFVNVNRKSVPEITANDNVLNQYVRNTSVVGLLTSPDEPSSKNKKLAIGDIMRVIGVTGKYYQVILPNDGIGFITASEINNKPLRTMKLTKEKKLFDQPDSTAAAITSLKSGTEVSVKGNYGNYIYAVGNGQEGWLLK